MRRYQGYSFKKKRLNYWGPKIIKMLKKRVNKRRAKFSNTRRVMKNKKSTLVFY